MFRISHKCYTTQFVSDVEALRNVLIFKMGDVPEVNNIVNYMRIADVGASWSTYDNTINISVIDENTYEVV